MINNKPLVSVVVLNWNGKRFIDSFLKSYLAINYPSESLELLFVDNGSSDDSLVYLQDNYKNIPNLRVIKNAKNYGYAGGNNRGIHQAKGNYVLVCNNDLEFDKNLLRELLKTSVEEKAAVVSPKLMYLNKHGYINNAGSRLEPNNDWPIHEIGANELDKGQYDTVREISAFCGACVLISREFLEKVGLFDNKFFLYFEDGDLSWRGQRAGFKYYYNPKAVAYHVHTGSSKEGSPLFNFYVGRNRLLILIKNAKVKVYTKAVAKTLRDHFILRIKNLFAAILGRYGKKQAISEFLQSQKMLWSAALLTPYALLKRFKIIKEDLL